MQRVLLIIGAIGVLGALIGGYAVWKWYDAGLAPVSTEGAPKIVRIPEGTSVEGIIQILRDESLIRDVQAFKLMLRIEGLSGQLKAGAYEISGSMGGEEIARHIASGKVAMRRLTIPEGLTLEQIAERMAEAALVEDAATFEERAVAETVASELAMPLPEGNLEGYLFPETYDFCCDLQPDPMIIRMVQELEERFYAPNRAEIEARGLSLHEIITLASLVEREARVDHERPLIAGVIQNRLDRGMRLQIDATVQYALPEHKERLLFADLKIDSPYNTYLHEGLPPGPIASPGLPALMAALRPAETDAFFYVARADGTHIFSHTFSEHQGAISRIRGR